MKKNILYTVGWGTIQDAAAYAGVSERVLSGWVKLGLKCIEMNKKTKLIRFSDIDDFLNGFHPDDPADVKKLTSELIKKAVGQN